MNREDAASAHERGEFALHGIGRSGFAFEGEEVAPGAYHVARVRWSAELLRRKYRRFAVRGPLPQVTPAEPGMRMTNPVGTGNCIDLDVFVCYGAPYIRGGSRAQEDNAVLGPITNDAGVWLTATCIKRLERDHPTPSELVVPPPTTGQEPNLILARGPGDAGTNGPYWFVESITSRSLVEASQAAWVAEPDRRRLAAGTHLSTSSA